MAEVTTSNSTASTQCSPLRKRAKMGDTAAADAFKSVGSLSFRIDNFREFTERLPPGYGSMRHCDAKVSVRGLTFGLAVYPRGYTLKEYNRIGMILKCENNASGCNVEDAFKPVGSLTFRIDNFREFSNSAPGEATMRHCDAKVSVRGLTFQLAVYPRGKVCKMCPPLDHLGILLKCENTSGSNVKGGGSWSCLASVTLRINLLLKSGEYESGTYTHKFFSSKEKSSLEWEDNDPWNFEYLMDPRNGLYNEKEDTLELVAKISVDTPVGIIELPKMDAIRVNGETVLINKNNLATHSRFFYTMFYNAHFDEGQSGEYKVQIEAPAAVEHFQRMLQTMYPENRPLDDRCIEGVLYLANLFLLNDVEGKCLEFLREESKKSALFKYRMADKYGYTALKDHVLDNLKDTDFEKKLFKTNMAEYNQLGSDAAEVFMASYDELFPPEADEEVEVE